MRATINSTLEALVLFTRTFLCSRPFPDLSLFVHIVHGPAGQDLRGETCDSVSRGFRRSDCRARGIVGIFVKILAQNQETKWRRGVA